MASNSKSKQQGQRDLKWKRKLIFVQRYWKDKFPSKDDYDFSVWAMWESRIRKGHKVEENLIAKAAKRWESSLTEEKKELMPDDMFADDYWHALQITNAMYAALVVSLWSSIEGFLKDLACVCKRARHSNKKHPRFDFKRIKQSFKEIGIDLKQLPKYSTVNAINIFNNSFKHSEGFYRPKSGKPYTHIDPKLLTKWESISKRFVDLKEIDYTKLPIRELVIACNLFFQSLLSAVKKNLEELGHGS
ncbi:MAG TPA: hypothetical protein VMW72_26555 [Sedimentisphaerales bacterium]|nr:hypothetical protein [Sedimentisphaerales bacterium]